MSGPTRKIKRVDLTLSDKLLVIEDLEKNTPQVEVAKKFGVSQSQISRIAKRKENLSALRNNANPLRRRSRKSIHDNIDSALLQWFKQAESIGLHINGPILREKAKDLGRQMDIDFDPSSSWITRWRARNLIVFKPQPVEEFDHNLKAAELWITSTWPDIQKHYCTSEIYNCNETIVYFRAIPEGSKEFNDNVLPGDNKLKERLTVLLAANMDGSVRLKPLVVGNTKRQSFWQIKNFPVTYRYNGNAIMTSTIFREWLECIDARLQKQNKKICLLLNNCPAHKVKENDFKCIEFVYLPSNVSFPVQPLDQGIIRNFKHYYRARLLQKILLSLDSGEAITSTEVAKSLSLLDTFYFMRASWNDVSEDTILNCFFRALTPMAYEDPFDGFTSEEIPTSFTREAYAEYINVDVRLEKTDIKNDFEICKESPQNRRKSDHDNCSECSSDVDRSAVMPPSNKEVLIALDTIRSWLRHEGLNSDNFSRLETELLDRMQSNIEQTAVESLLNKHHEKF